MRDVIRKAFLGKYRNEPFVIQQKTAILVWIGLFTILVILGFMAINAMRSVAHEYAAMLALDTAFLVSIIACFQLIRTGRYHATVNMSIFLGMLIVVIGHVTRIHIQVATGFNPYSIILLAFLVYTSMFSTRRLLVLMSLLDIILTVSVCLYSADRATAQIQVYLLTNALNVIVIILIISCLSYQNSVITEKAFAMTQQELERNRELAQTLEQKVEERTAELKKSISEIKILSGLLPICAACKKVRDDKGYWNQIEWYIHEHSEAKFSHGICPECAKKLYPDEFAEIFPELAK